MSFRSRLSGEKIVQISTADYADGWTVTPISFILIEDRWGRRSYQVKTPRGGGLGERQFALFNIPILAWIKGGDLPPAELADRRTVNKRSHGAALPTLTQDAADSLSRSERERLSKVLEMLNSQHDGEIVNAAKAAAAFLKTRNLTWSDALGIHTRD